MTGVTRDQAQMLTAWLDTLDPDGERLAIAMGEVPEDDWEALIASFTIPFGADGVVRVISRAHELLGKAPTDARSLARLAIRISRRASNDGSPDIDLIEGDAWRELAAAHLETAEYADAHDAIERSRACYARSKSSRLNAAILALYEGRTLFELGRWSEALAAVGHGSSELLECRADRKKYVQARTIHASILAGMGQYDAALDVFSDAADLAKQAGDKETLAYIVWNTGLLAAKLDDTARAKRCLDSALRYFERLGLTAEMPHVRAALVVILKQQGRYNEAVSELFKVRAEFLSLGIPVAAAIASLRIVEVLLLSGRTSDVPARCEEMVKTFTAARLPKNLLMALAYLNEAARQDKLKPSDVTYVAEFVEKAENDASRAFTLPS